MYWELFARLNYLLKTDKGSHDVIALCVLSVVPPVYAVHPQSQLAATSIQVKKHKYNIFPSISKLSANVCGGK